VWYTIGELLTKVTHNKFKRNNSKILEKNPIKARLQLNTTVVTIYGQNFRNWLAVGAYYATHSLYSFNKKFIKYKMLRKCDITTQMLQWLVTCDSNVTSPKCDILYYHIVKKCDISKGLDFCNIDRTMWKCDIIN